MQWLFVILLLKILWSELLMWVFKVICYNLLLQLIATVNCYCELFQSIAKVNCFSEFLQWNAKVNCYSEWYIREEQHAKKNLYDICNDMREEQQCHEALRTWNAIMNWREEQQWDNPIWGKNRQKAYERIWNAIVNLYSDGKVRKNPMTGGKNSTDKTLCWEIMQWKSETKSVLVTKKGKKRRKKNHCVLFKWIAIAIHKNEVETK